ncbi:MAG TPA: maleylpyruvate isomerase family mycothiol-dependent enzyme [Nocardioidaceae bacterium]|nr:maleylpyruvate isomerase family mycothiol-dependent enzyme [Nocardioidaceae bacterium]
MKLPQLHETILATTRYLEALTSLSDDDCRQPSALPGWTRAHVVTHLARNADALVNLLHWGQTGVESPMYASQEQRDQDIDSGASRGVEELRADSVASCGRFLQAANELHTSRFDAEVSRLPGSPPFPVTRVGGMRRTEVEVHHADLLIGYTAYDWPEDFTRHLLQRRQRELGEKGLAMVWRLTDTGESIHVLDGGPEVSAHSADLVWWLLGRGNGDGLVTSGPGLPELGRWA